MSEVARAARRNWLAAAAFVVIVLAVGAALAAPWLPLIDPDMVDTPHRLQPPLKRNCCASGLGGRHALLRSI